MARRQADGARLSETPQATRHVELIPREFLRLIAIWSLIPSYLVAGGLLGWLVDRWLGIFPYATGVGLILALVVAVRDMLRLRDEM